MFDPIILTVFGEILKGYSDNKSTDENDLSMCIGVHDICSGWVDLKYVSATHRAIICRNCGLRLVIPREVKTYGHLRAYARESMLSWFISFFGGRCIRLSSGHKKDEEGICKTIYVGPINENHLSIVLTDGPVLGFYLDEINVGVDSVKNRLGQVIQLI